MKQKLNHADASHPPPSSFALRSLTTPSQRCCREGGQVPEDGGGWDNCNTNNNINYEFRRKRCKTKLRKFYEAGCDCKRLSIEKLTSLVGSYFRRRLGLGLPQRISLGLNDGYSRSVSILLVGDRPNGYPASSCSAQTVRIFTPHFTSLKHQFIDLTPKEVPL